MKIFDTDISIGKIFQDRPYPQAFTFKKNDNSIYYKWLPFIYSGQFNPDLESNDVKKVMITLEKLFTETQTDTHRLATNYTVSSLKYEQMHVFGIVWDMVEHQPVCLSGLQDISSTAGRLLSRYYVFLDYRPNGKHTFTNDIDDYAMLKIQKLIGQRSFDIMFISRDTNQKYFHRLKKYRSEIYGDFEIYPDKLELLYENNWQSIFYINNSKDPKSAINILETLQYRRN